MIKRIKNDIGIKVSLITIICNSLLAFIKFIAGIVANSSVIVSDAIHTLSDVISTIIVIVGLKISRKQNDDEHQYGHDRLECVASVILAVVLIITGIFLGLNSIRNIIIVIILRIENQIFFSHIPQSFAF